MGNYLTSSNRPSSFELLKQQVKELGDKYPFGDDEILRIARCLTYLRHGTSASSKEIINYSFLNDWAVFAPTLPPADFTPSDVNVPFVNLLKVDQNLIQNENTNEVDFKVKENRMRIRKMMLLIEAEILPPWFGRKLEETVFVLLAPSQTTLAYGHGHDHTATEDLTVEDLAMQRLEKFLNGLAESSRRGSRKALAVIYNCCVESNSKNINQKTASANDLLDLAYRLGLASLLLSGRLNERGNDDDVSESDNGGENVLKESSANAMEECVFAPFYPTKIDQSLVQSLIEFASNYSSHSAPPSDYLSMATGSLTLNEDKVNGGNNDGDNKMVSLEAFTAWTESYAPALSATLETFIHYVFFSDKPFPPSRIEFMFPFLRGQQSAFLKSKSSPLLFSFAVMSPSLGGSWHRLYTSDEDGLSFNRLQNSLLGYGGPTLLIIKEVEGGGIFGAFTSTKWKETKDFYGNSDCFLFQLQPNVKVMRPRGRGGNNFMYCNSESRSRGYDGQAHGIGFGGTVDKPRLFIPESFDGCIASASDLTFEGGSLLPPLKPNKDDFTFGLTNRKYFDIESLEVWGVGGDELVASALEARSEQRDITAANIRKARKVDKAQFLDDFKSGLIESKAFQHRDEMRGRDDCHIDDEKPNIYVYEK